jgi:hypothetical protein
MNKTWKTVFTIVGALIALFVLIQFVPYGKNHINPPVVNEPKWDSQQTQKLVTDGCYNCHSNLTTYPWYSNVAPASWLLQRDIDEARANLNFSDLTSAQGAAMLSDIERQLTSGEMPPVYYTAIHPEARLTTAQREELLNGLKITFSK